MNKKAYAIDYGTSNSLILNVSPDKVSKPLNVDNQKALMKSITYFLDDETYYHGLQAIEEYEKNSFEGRFVRSIKKFLPDDKFRHTKIGERFFLIESIIGFFLKELKQRADKLSGEEIKKVLLGRPAKYHIDKKADHLAQERMIRAAKIAGFDEIDFYPEPLAAANNFPEDLEWNNLFVIDIGAGTSDYTWVYKEDKSDNYQVMALNSVNTAGDSFDGDIMKNAIGEDFATHISYSLPMSSNVLEMPQDIAFRLRSPADISFLTKMNIHDFLNEIKKSTLDKESLRKVEQLEILLEDNLAYQIYRKIEEAKISLSKGHDYQFQYKYPGIEIDKLLKAKDFPEWVKNSIDKIIKGLTDTIKMSEKDPKSIDLVLLTGGSSQIPALKERLEEQFSNLRFVSPEDFHSVGLGLGKRMQEILRLQS